jgi:hypothetical protein
VHAVCAASACPLRSVLVAENCAGSKNTSLLKANVHVTYILLALLRNTRVPCYSRPVAVNARDALLYALHTSKPISLRNNVKERE